MTQFSEQLRLMLERLFCQSFPGICHMWLQICKKNLHSTKKFNGNQFFQSVTQWFNATRSQSRKREISTGDCRWNQPPRSLAGQSWRFRQINLETSNTTHQFSIIVISQICLSCWTLADTLRLITTTRTLLNKIFQGFLEMLRHSEQLFTMLKSWFLLQI